MISQILRKDWILDSGLRGKIALVTGGTTGIGKAIVNSLTREGASVAFCARSADQVNARLESLTAAGHNVQGYVGDVTDDAFLANFVESAAADLGGLDLIVANSGGGSLASFSDTRSADWLSTYQVNVGYSAMLARLAVPHLKSRGGGSIVFISSISGWKPAPNIQYGAAKAALIYLAQALARLLASDGIRVNAVSPGSVLYEDGPWNEYRDSDPAGFQQYVDRQFPAGRLGTAEEIAEAVLLLLSPRASWISGTNLAVDGAQEGPSAAPW
jgi:3-oxoacyl-[acyl-carrier protein] reductase